MGASADVWCGIMKVLNEKYPRRAAEPEGMNETIRLVAELEAAYRDMPVIGAGPVGESRRE